jgi:hypothetical protein
VSGASSYVWDNGAEEGVLYPLNETTTFTVTGTDEIGCSSTATITVIADVCTGIDDVEIVSNYLVYPNPSNGSISIDFELFSENNKAIIFQLDGKKIKSYDLDASISNNIILDKIPSGNYILKIIENNSVSEQKIVIK